MITDLERSIRFGAAHTLEAELAFEEPLARASVRNFDFDAFAAHGAEVIKLGRSETAQPRGLRGP